MKKHLFTTLLVSAFVILSVPLSASAQSTGIGISIDGKFPTSYTPPVGSVVTVTCGSQTNQPKTDSKGNFITNFNVTEDCKAGSSVLGYFGSYSDSVKVNSNNKNASTLQLRQTTAVPEMGTIAAMGAVGAVGAMFFMVRRNQMQS